MPVLRTALGLAMALSGAAAAQTPPDAFEGLWSSQPDACDPDATDGSAIRVRDATLYGAGSTCRMTTPVNVRDMEAVLYDMVCEDDGRPPWTARAMMLRAADGGLVLVWNGFAFKYVSCAAAATAQADP